MYSEHVTAAQIERLEAKLGVRLQRYPVAKVDEWVDHLTKLRTEDGKLKRALRAEERDFITNEQLLSRCDFHHWRERYCWFIPDGGGISRLQFWQSQEIFNRLVCQAEEEAWDAAQAGDPIEGIKFTAHKSRQLGATQYARAITMHRQTTATNQRALAASVDDKQVKELYDRDKFIWEHLPWYMQPSLDPNLGNFDVKAEHLFFAGLHTSILYQDSKQQTGLGQGRQFEVSHLTECASWVYSNIIRLHFIPTISRSLNTFCFLESTAQGRGNWWHEWTEDCRQGRQRGWRYVFIPWYVESTKYRAKPPENWRPSELSLLHAKKIHDTSPEFAGRRIFLPREQLYWYETERAAALQAGELNLFLTNYAATPEESFQHTNQSAFSPELLEALRLETRMGTPYDLVVGGVQ
jgi:hypothetical protein